MEEIVAMKRENSTSFIETWRAWVSFLYSPEYQLLNTILQLPNKVFKVDRHHIDSTISFSSALVPC